MSGVRCQATSNLRSIAVPITVSPSLNTQRVAASEGLALLHIPADVPNQVALDRISRTARRLFRVPYAGISLVDTSRQWFISYAGEPLPSTVRSVAFCAQAILSDHLLLVSKPQADARFAANPLVTGPPHIRFYAGYPLTSPTGDTWGTLCLLDNTATPLKPGRPGRLTGSRRSGQPLNWRRCCPTKRRWRGKMPPTGVFCWMRSATALSPLIADCVSHLSMR